MLEEIQSIRSHMTEIQVIKRGEREYYTGKINDHDVVLVFSRWGKVAAATTATSLITEFNIDQLIFTGAAGAVAPTLNIGDIVVSGQLYQHDMDPRPLMPLHQIPLTGITFFKADSSLIAKANAVTNSMLSSLSQRIKPEILKEFNITSPKSIVGTIATGDQFIHETSKTEAILAEKPETSAVEMEGAAVAQVCTDYKIPFVVIRAISDKADHKSSIDFSRFIEEVVKHYSEDVITGMLTP